MEKLDACIITQEEFTELVESAKDDDLFIYDVPTFQEDDGMPIAFDFIYGDLVGDEATQFGCQYIRKKYKIKGDIKDIWYYPYDKKYVVFSEKE